jgi:hypothetical protein
MPRQRLLAVLLLLGSLALAAGMLRVAWRDHALIDYLESR